MRSGPIGRLMTRRWGSPGITPFTRAASMRSRSSEMAALMQNWVVRKPVAASRGGVVASQNGVAATVGAEILAAGGLARAGLPVDWYVTLKTANAAEDLRRYDESRRMWLPDNLPPVCPSSGEPPALILGRLADTLSRLAEAGPDDFYQGEIAQAIAADSAAAGGVLSAADLAECRARIVPSLEIAYRSYALQAARGLTAAPTLADVIH